MEPFVRKINYYETDKMGITHHSNYIRIMEEARVDFLEKLGFGFEKLEAEGVGSPIVGLECSYKSPTTFADEVTVELKVAKLSAVKVIFDYKMTCGGKLVFVANSTHCFIDKEGHPVIVEKRFPQFYKALSDHLL